MESGAYAFSQLPIGVYTLTAALPGFRTVTMTDLRLGVGDRRTMNIRLEVSGVETAVSVEALATPLDNSSAVVGAVIGSEHMREVPLNGRHWASLMALAPGAINRDRRTD